MAQRPGSITLEVPVSTHLHLFIMGKWMEDRRSVARPCGHGLVSIHFSLDRSVLVGLKGPRGEERETEDLSPESPGLTFCAHPRSQCGASAALLQVFTEIRVFLRICKDNYKNLYPGLEHLISVTPRNHVKKESPDMVTLAHNPRAEGNP